jgi:arylsulfatase A-like enzyme
VKAKEMPKPMNPRHQNLRDGSSQNVRLANRRWGMRIAVDAPTLLLFVLCGTIVTTAAESSRKPNIILMMADDLGWGDTGFNGNPIIKTPCLDQMSREGITFSRFYAASSVCSPTRGACLTGRHPYRYGVYTANKGHLRAGEVCLAEVLQQQGYMTGHFGKWHLGTLTPDYSGKGPRRQPQANYCTPGMSGFDEWFSTEFAVATWDPYDPANSHVNRNSKVDPRALYWHNGKNVAETLTGCDSKLIVDKAIPFVQRAVGQDKPFFAVVWFHAPHAPVVGGPEFRAMYADLSEDEQHYYAVVTALDVQVGRLRTALKKAGVEDNTMLWFCSDNGPEGNPGRRGRFQGSAGSLRGRKRSLYEGGVRVPSLLVWPDRIQQARTVDAPCVTSDYFPTIMQVLDLPMPKRRPYDGIGILPIIDGTMIKRTQPIGFQFGNQASWNDNRYKLVHNPGGRRHRSDNGTIPVAEFELYDLLSDRAETHNIAEEQPEIVERMKTSLAAWQESCQRSDQGLDY